MGTPQKAIIFVRGLCYLRSADKILNEARRHGIRVSRDTVERELREYQARHTERRSFKPEADRRACNDEQAGKAAIEAAKLASVNLGMAVRRYQERRV